MNKKLNFLLDSYLDQTIDSEIYKKKKNELFEKKLKIQEEIGDIQKHGSNWVEPMREFINCALQAQKIARAKNNCQDLVNLGKTVGSNFFLCDRRLTASLREPFAALCAPPPAQSYLVGTRPLSRSAGARGVEPLTKVLETSIMPFN